MTEFDQLSTSLLWASDADDCIMDAGSMIQLQTRYEQFVNSIPDWIVDSIENVCLVMGDCYEQLAHDYVMTSMGHGVGFWETSDWESSAGQVLTDLCKSQGTLETYIGDDNKLYIV